MGDYTHYYWFTGKDCFADTISGRDACVEGKYEKRNLDVDMGRQYLDAISLGVWDGLKEMAESPEELIKEAAFGAALGMGVTIGAPFLGFAGISGLSGIEKYG